MEPTEEREGTDRDVFVTVRMPESLREEAIKLAAKSERTLAAEIRHALRARLEESHQ